MTVTVIGVPIVVGVGTTAPSVSGVGVVVAVAIGDRGGVYMGSGDVSSGDGRSCDVCVGGGDVGSSGSGDGGATP